MKIEVWFKLAENSCLLLENFVNKALQKNESLNDLLKSVSLKISEQWISTHNNGVKQVEKGLAIQGTLITQQYDVRVFLLKNF